MASIAYVSLQVNGILCVIAKLRLWRWWTWRHKFWAADIEEVAEHILILQLHFVHVFVIGLFTFGKNITCYRCFKNKGHEAYRKTCCKDSSMHCGCKTRQIANKWNIWSCCLLIWSFWYERALQTGISKVIKRFWVSIAKKNYLYNCWVRWMYSKIELNVRMASE